MAFDGELADRIRALIALEPGVTEKRMFGGLAFLVEGRLSVAASGRGGLMVRVEPEETDALLLEPYARTFTMRDRPMDGWLRVDEEGLETEEQLAAWVRRGVGFARALGPKA